MQSLDLTPTFEEGIYCRKCTLLFSKMEQHKSKECMPISQETPFDLFFTLNGRTMYVVLWQFVDSG